MTELQVRDLVVEFIHEQHRSADDSHIVEVTLVLFIWKYRRQRRDRFADGPQIHGATNLELLWTAAPVVILFLIIVFVIIVLTNIIFIFFILKVPLIRGRGEFIFLFIPFCFYEAAANLLTNPALDPFGKIPEFKFCAARVSAPTRNQQEGGTISGR